LKILHIITDLGVGGAEIMLLSLVKEHLKINIEMHVIALTGEGPIGDRLKEMGVPVTILGMRTEQIYSFALFRLIRLIRNIKPDLIQTWMYHADLMGALANPLSGNQPVIWGLHHTLGKISNMKERTKKVIKLNARLSHWIPEKIICCSEATRKTHIGVGYAAEKMSVIQNGVETDRFHPNVDVRESVRSELDLEPNARLIGMVARFNPQKDHYTFILAANYLHKTYPDVHFILAGENIIQENRVLFGWIKATGLENHIHLLGLRNDIPRLAAALDIASLSSAYGDAFPVSICEAMACGVPCVVTDVGDSREIVGRTGVCVEPGNSIALAEGWKRLLLLDQVDYAHLSEQAQQRIAKEYNIMQIANRYMETYLSVINKNAVLVK
jgi:glycosyltransferase involved in cell wall biosynthesis